MAILKTEHLTIYLKSYCRILTKLLEVSDDPQVLAVAAHDVGEYVRHYPRGKRYGNLGFVPALNGKAISWNPWKSFWDGMPTEQR